MSKQRKRKVVGQKLPHAKKRMTLEELEAILNSEEPLKVTIDPDGGITAVPKRRKRKG